MFSQTWRKYLPLILLFLKKAIKEPQALQLNKTDFERALGGRKIKLSFSQLEMNKGRINSLLKNTPLAKDLALVLQEDDAARTMLRTRNVVFGLTPGFELQITDVTPEPQNTDAKEEETEPST